jgi:hypothetical protein
MTTSHPVDASGNPIGGGSSVQRSDEPKPKPHSHLPTRLHRYVERKITAALHPAMAGVRDALFERDERIEKLERDVSELRRLLDTQRQITALAARIDALEVDGAAAIVPGVRPNGSPRHDG